MKLGKFLGFPQILKIGLFRMHSELYSSHEQTN